MNLLRVISFGTVYFILFIGYFTYQAIRTLATAEPDALIWYFSHYSLPQLILKLLFWLVHAPMMILILIQMGILSAVFALVTDWIVGLIGNRRMRLARATHA